MSRESNGFPTDPFSRSPAGIVSKGTSGLFYGPQGKNQSSATV